MEKDFCTKCPLKCRFNDHSYSDYAIEYFEDEKVEIIEESQIKYNKANSKKTFAEQILVIKQNEYYNHCYRKYHTQPYFSACQRQD